MKLKILTDYVKKRLKNQWFSRFGQTIIHLRLKYTHQKMLISLISQVLVPFVGFKRKLTAADKWYESDSPVDIIKVNVVRIGCNIARGSYDNGVESHIIHEFYPTVEPGFKIVEQPNNVIYLPVNVKQLDNITLTITDQEGRLVNFRGETITARLHLKQQNGARIRRQI